MENTVEFLPLINEITSLLFQVLTVVLMVVLSWATVKFGGKFGVDKESIMFSTVDKLIQRAMIVAEARLKEEFEEKDWTKIEFKNAMIAEAATIVSNQAPVYLSKLKLDEDKLTDLIESRIIKK